MSEQKGKRTRRVHTRKFKADTVALVRKGGRSVPQVADELGLANSLVYDWCRQAEVDEGKGATGAITTAEKEELSHLRREVKVLRMEREISPIRSTASQSRPTCWSATSPRFVPTSPGSPT